MSFYYEKYAVSSSNSLHPNLAKSRLGILLADIFKILLVDLLIVNLILLPKYANVHLGTSNLVIDQIFNNSLISTLRLR